MRHGLGDWIQFVREIKGKFDVEEYTLAMRNLLNLVQKIGVEE